MVFAEFVCFRGSFLRAGLLRWFCGLVTRLSTSQLSCIPKEARSFSCAVLCQQIRGSRKTDIAVKISRSPGKMFKSIWLDWLFVFTTSTSVDTSNDFKDRMTDRWNVLGRNQVCGLPLISKINSALMRRFSSKIRTRPNRSSFICR